MEIYIKRLVKCLLTVVVSFLGRHFDLNVFEHAVTDENHIKLPKYQLNNKNTNSSHLVKHVFKIYMH